MDKKILVTQLLLLLYAWAIFRPMLPIVDYYINYDYIAEQLCENRDKPILACNGQCYLAEEISETLPFNNTTNHSNIPSLDIDKIPISTIPKFSFTFKENIDSGLQRFFSYAPLKEATFIQLLLKPPKF